MPTQVRYQGRGRRTVSCLTIKRRGNCMLRSLGLGDAELSVLLCDDSTIRSLNRRYRRKNRACDVLSFSMREGQRLRGSDAILGDIVISLPAVARRASETEARALDEATYLLAHGLLHLLGFDHQTSTDERRMNVRVRRLVEEARGR
jgi:probable rRNA maturation factor